MVLTRTAQPARSEHTAATIEPNASSHSMSFNAAPVSVSANTIKPGIKKNITPAAMKDTSEIKSKSFDGFFPNVFIAVKIVPAKAKMYGKSAKIENERQASSFSL